MGKDTSGTAVGRMCFQILSAIAEFAHAPTMNSIAAPPAIPPTLVPAQFSGAVA